MSLLFWFGIFLLFYTFAGYPLLLVVLNKLLPSKTYGKEAYQPSVEVILIVRNVSTIIEAKINSLLSLDYPEDKLKILIVSDDSEDDTVEVIRRLAHRNVRCIENNSKSTKSACLNQAIAISEAEVLFMTDARQQHEPDSLGLLAAYFYDDSVGAVSGELILRDPQTNEFSEGIDAYWKYEKFIRHNESKLASVAGVTGAVYAMRREYYQPIPPETLLDDVLIPMNMILQGKVVLFEPEALAFDIPSSDIQREKIRKTRTLAGNWQLLELSPQLLNPLKNGIWFQFLSHKILRLISPFLLVGILLTSAKLATTSYFYALILLGQVAGYSTIILANFLPQLMEIKLVRIGHSFMLLMWFTLLGFWSFFTRRHLAIWK